MIFVFVEDGTLELIGNIEQARQQYEGIDVESEVYHFYNDQCVYLKPVFSTPTIIRKFLWLSMIKSGEYDLQPAPAEGDDIEICLQETNAIKENNWFKSKDEIFEYLNLKHNE